MFADIAGHKSWLTPKCPKTLIPVMRPAAMPIFVCGTLSVPHRCEVVLPLKLLAADHLQTLDSSAVCAFHTRRIDAKQKRSFIGGAFLQATDHQCKATEDIESGENHA